MRGAGGCETGAGCKALVQSCLWQSVEGSLRTKRAFKAPKFLITLISEARSSGWGCGRWARNANLLFFLGSQSGSSKHQSL